MAMHKTTAPRQVQQSRISWRFFFSTFLVVHDVANYLQPKKKSKNRMCIKPGLYMIGYGKGNIILKVPPFFRLNEENKKRENSRHQMKTKTVCFCFCFHLILNFLLLIFLVQSEERLEF